MPPLTLPRAPSSATLNLLSNALRDLRIGGVAEGRRHASHQAQGRANKAKDGPGKRLGAKKSGGEYVVPGNILFRQRGTLWFPGENCFMGRDHTIHAGAPGYVRYYRDPARHPTHKFIGIALAKDQALPTPGNAARRRQLGMLAFPMLKPAAAASADPLTHDPSNPTSIRQVSNDARRKVVRRGRQGGEDTVVTLRPGYQYRQANHEIGRAGDRLEREAKARGRTTRVYPEFVPGDRFAAWRKRRLARARMAEQRVRRGKKAKK
ncbi:54S ribosomal protein L2, mitochondrial-like [Teratosphaeria destructans]|uniref:Large ribosomal subunit protein bL27m n=1 Tax=Teratosphaeria destructans TaxID=418781 RepID=A0A9W7SWU4_9PEZI|nr:54S ribosomal protein L2, mitochondrial-like [Teratosphaeria destructans]